ncbi:hypothetical protein PHYC_00864 [Phycisphaerales bacterium]|nr:hypothetical protein PHYC_00864 [Phycisphaerales bacterium]
MADEPRIQDLSQDEQELIAARQAQWVLFLERAGIEPSGDEDSPELSDHLVRWWHRQKEGERPDANDVVWSIGAVIGDILTEILPLEWKLVIDADGAEMALVGQDTDGNDVTVFIIHAIAKRFGGHPDGFVVDFLNGLIEPLAQRFGLEPPDEEPA